MIYMSVLPGHMPLTVCLSYVYIVSKLGVLFQVHIMLCLGISTLTLFLLPELFPFFQCSFTCRLTITFHASFSDGFSSNSCAVGRPYLYRTPCSATK